MSADVGDAVRYQGRLGVISRNRLNGMYDIAFEFNGKLPEIGKGSSYTCGGSVECVYRNEFQLVEEYCAKCGKAICESDGRFRFVNGTQCSECGDRTWITEGLLMEQ